MNLRPKTKRRLMVLLAAAALCAIALWAGITVQLHRHEAVRRRFRDKAMADYVNGDYAAAIINFKRYLTQSTPDAPAIFAYAVSRSEVPEPDLRHLVEAKSIFSRYLEINPSDTRAQHRLLDIYRRIRYDAEALSLAQALLAEDPNDVDALLARRQALIDQGEYESALDISRRINDLSPLDLESQITTYRLMAQLRMPSSQMVDRAQRMLTDHPDDPHFQLLCAVAAGYDGDEKSVEKWLNLASSVPAPDTQFVQELSSLFEHVGMFEQSRKTLANWLDAPHADPLVTAQLVEREFQAQNFQAALDRLNQINESDPKTNAQLMGLKALILLTRGNAEDRDSADLIRLNLARRRGENTASAWNSLLRARFSIPPVSAKDAVSLCQSALHRDPENAIGRHFLGLAYENFGENELALECWRIASRLAPSWAAPHISRAKILLDTGHTELACAEAQAASACSENSLRQAVTLALATYARMGSAPSQSELSSLLASIQSIQHQTPDEPKTLPIEVDLLARTARRREALEIARAALASQTIHPNFTADDLLQLARIINKNHLGIEPAIADTIEQIKPLSPEAAYDRALILAMLGEPADALRSLTQQRDASASDSPQWQLAILRFRQNIGEDDLTNFAALADALPKNLAVQRAVLSACADGPNRGLTNRTIERIRALAGEECISWRLARARWELAGTSNIKTNAGAAAAMMGDVVRMAPDLAEPQILWATALERLGDFNGAIDRLRTAASLEPGDFDIALRLADRLQLTGDDDESRDLLESTAQNQVSSPDRQVQIADILWQQAQPDAAIRVLKLPGSRIDPVQRDLLLAQIDQSNNHPEEAARIYDALVKSPTPSGDVIEAVARFYAERGDIPAARQLLERLPEPRELALAHFDETYGSPDAAMAHYQAALNASPADLTMIKELAGYQLRREQFEGASATCDAGIKTFPSDRDLSTLKSRAAALSSLPSTPAAKLLITTISRHPADEVASRTLDAMLLDRAEPDLSNSAWEHLRIVADINPRFLPAQMLLAEGYFASAQIDEARKIAARAASAFPLQPEPQQFLTNMDSAVGRWNEALSAAQQFRKRAPADHLNADIAIARAQLHLNDPAAAIAQIASYLPQAKASPNQNFDVIDIQANALLLQGKPDQVTSLLEPLLPQSPRWRTLWLDLGAKQIKDRSAAHAWIEKTKSYVRDGGDDDRLSFARACFQAGARFTDATFFTEAKDAAAPLFNRSNPATAAMLLEGQLSQALNDPAAAENEFRKVLQADPENAEAKNALASIILARNEDLSDARRLCEEAVLEQPTNSAFRYTLACIQSKAGDLPAADLAFKQAAALDCTNPNALLGLADIQFRSGNKEEAATTLTEAENLLPSHPLLSADAQKHLSDLRLALHKIPQTTAVSDLK